METGLTAAAMERPAASASCQSQECMAEPAHLQMKPRGSAAVDFSSTLAGFRSPCTMPRPWRYSKPFAMSSSERHTDTCHERQ